MLDERLMIFKNKLNWISVDFSILIHTNPSQNETDYEKCEKREVNKYNDSRNEGESTYRKYLEYAHATRQTDEAKALETKKASKRNCPCKEEFFE